MMGRGPLRRLKFDLASSSQRGRVDLLEMACKSARARSISESARIGARLCFAI